ncbi:MAG: amidohydrolase [Desulfovermiculus sp.]
MNCDIAPDLIIHNARIHIQDPGLPQASALAMGCGQILAVGDARQILKAARPKTQIIDAKDRLLLPGLMDSHFHYQDWALGRAGLELASVSSLQEALENVSRATQQAQSGEWILGQGWNEGDWPEKRMPTRYDLDRAAPDHPVALARCDLHLFAVNTKALELAGITSQTPDPPEGLISRDEHGQPDGILKEQAIGLVKAAIPDPGEEHLLQAMQAGIPVLHSLGLTAIHDVRLKGAIADGAMMLRAWQRLDQETDLKLRCWSSLPGEIVSQAASLGLRTGFGSQGLRLGHLKYFADGGMGARTAWMIEPYEDGGSGLPLISMQELRDMAFQADRSGLAVMIHAIGDRSSREVISILEQVHAQRKKDQFRPFSPPHLNHRIEHLQMVRPEDLDRLARLPVDVCVQPSNQVIDIALLDACLGERGKWAYAFRSMLDAGVRLLFSSDSPVCDPSPLMGMHALCTRQRPDGTPDKGWHPEQCLSVAEAVHGYTLAPAQAYGVDHELGSLSPGKRADCILLDRDIYSIDPRDIQHARVDMTVFDGKIVYIRE